MKLLYVFLVPALAFGGCRVISRAERPNVVLILADDLGYGDLGCTGHPYAETPAMDALAKEGTLFLKFYQAGATCVPTRTALMTSRFPATYQDHPLYFGFGEAITVTELLRQRGYCTGHFGKWHIGPGPRPGTYGIDSVRVMGGRPRDPGGRDAVTASAAIEFMRANRERPFYVNIWFHSPHFEVHPSASVTDRFAEVTVRRSDFPNPDMQQHFDVYESLGGNLNEGMRNYLGEVLQLDSQVGRVLRAIDDLGLRNNTIVAFTSDNGPAECTTGGLRPGGSLKENMLGSAGPYRGRKHSLYDGGIHQPLIIRWPGHVSEGRVDSSSVVAGVDWLPSLCTIAGIAIDPSRFDGEDVSDVWMGDERERQKDLFWKGYLATGKRVIMRGTWKLHSYQSGMMELYDLAGDPGERENVAGRHPAVAADLRTAVERWNSLLPTSYRKAPPEGEQE